MSAYPPIPLLIDYDEQDVFAIQAECEQELCEFLTQLTAFVTEAPVPFSKKLYLLNGIGHLRGHILSEGRGMSSEISGRVN